MKKIKAQASIEYISIIALFFLAIIGVLIVAYSMQNNASIERDINEAQKSINKLSTAAEFVNTHSYPTKLVVDVVVPNTVDQLVVGNKTIGLRIATTSGYTDIYALTKPEVVWDYYKASPPLSAGGPYNIVVESLPDGRVNFYVSGIGAVEGYVYDPFNQKLPGVRIIVSGGSAITDSGGYYLIKGVPKGNMSITASKYGYVSQTEYINVTESETTRFDFYMIYDNGTIEGRVVSGLNCYDYCRQCQPYCSCTPGCDPVENATVTLIPSGFSAETDSNGDYKIDDIPLGTYTVTFSMDKFITDDYPSPITLSPTLLTATANMKLYPLNGTIYGTVKDQYSNLVENVSVVIPDINSSKNTTTDSNGKYNLNEILPASYNLSFSKRGYQTQTLYNVTVGYNESVEKNVTLNIGVNLKYIDGSFEPILVKPNKMENFSFKIKNEGIWDSGTFKIRISSLNESGNCSCPAGFTCPFVTCRCDNITIPDPGVVPGGNTMVNLTDIPTPSTLGNYPVLIEIDIDEVVEESNESDNNHTEIIYVVEETCDNCIDDDLDGLIDWLDPDCEPYFYPGCGEVHECDPTDTDTCDTCDENYGDLPEIPDDNETNTAVCKYYGYNTTEWHFYIFKPDKGGRLNITFKSNATMGGDEKTDRIIYDYTDNMCNNPDRIYNIEPLNRTNFCAEAGNVYIIAFDVDSPNCAQGGSYNLTTTYITSETLGVNCNNSLDDDCDGDTDKDDYDCCLHLNATLNVGRDRWKGYDLTENNGTPCSAGNPCSCTGPAGWTELNFNDSAWNTITLPNPPINSSICGYCDFYRRKQIYLPGEPISVSYKFGSDDGMWLWINDQYIEHRGGACHAGGCAGSGCWNPAENDTTGWKDITKYFKKGDNIVAVHVSECTGVELFDMIFNITYEVC